MGQEIWKLIDDISLTNLYATNMKPVRGFHIGELKRYALEMRRKHVL